MSESELLTLFLREYPNECVSGSSGISHLQLTQLCRELNLSFNIRDTKKFLCQKIKRYLLERSMLPNTNTNTNTNVSNVNTTTTNTFLNDISPTALTAERELINPKKGLLQLLIYVLRYIKERVTLENHNELVQKLLIEINNKVNKLNISEIDRSMLMSVYKDILNDLDIDNTRISHINTLKVISCIILDESIPYDILSLDLPIFNTDYYKYSDVYVPKIPEEDSSIYSEITSDTDSIENEGNVGSCSNPDYLTLEPYTTEDSPIQIYTLNSVGKYEKSICITKEEFIMHLKTGQDSTAPEVLQTIYTTPSCGNRMCTNVHESLDGRGCSATGKLIVKIPPNNIYVTLGSIERVMKSNTREWYALPLYGGKRRRIGNLDELFAASRNHGQIPGFKIYKLFTKEEIQSGVDVKETSQDFPIYLFNNTKKLYEIIGGEVTIPFVNGVIDHLLF